MGKDIFISYHSKDSNLVKIICAVLERDGQLVWLDKNDIKASDIFPEKIKKGIRECKLALICIGKKIGDYQEKEIIIACIRMACKQCLIFPLHIPGFNEKCIANKPFYSIIKDVQNKKISRFIAFQYFFKIFFQTKDNLCELINKAVNESKKEIEEQLRNERLKEETICEKELKDYFNYINYHEYHKFMETLINGKQILSKVTIIGKEDLFDFYEKLTRKLLITRKLLDSDHQLGFYKILTPSNKDKSDENMRMKYSTQIWKTLDRYVEYKPHEPHNKVEENEIINSLIRNKKYIFMTVTIDPDNDDIDINVYIQTCEAVIIKFKKFITKNIKNIRLVFVMYIKNNFLHDNIDSISDILPECMEKSSEKDTEDENVNFINFNINNFVNTEKTEVYKYLSNKEKATTKILQELIHCQDIFDDNVLINSYDLFKELKRLICNQ